MIDVMRNIFFGNMYMGIICDVVDTRTVYINKSLVGGVRCKYFHEDNVFVIFSIMGLNLVLDLAFTFIGYPK